MRRREFLSAVGSAAVAWPLAARAQQSSMPIVGFLNGQSPQNFAHLARAFGAGLNETGYAEGRNVAVEYRWAEGQVGRLPALAADLVTRRVAVIAATGGAHHAARAATSTIPIVVTMGGDPVKEGLVASLNRPGGNLTGVSAFVTTLEAKRLELLHELVPQATLIGVIRDPTFSASEVQLQEIQAAARALARRVLIENVSNDQQIDAAFAKLRDAKVGGVLVTGSPFNNSRRAHFVSKVAEYAIPAVYENRETAQAGGLVSYGASLPDLYRQVGVYAGRILKGEKVSDLPVALPTKFEMVVNLKTAKALGISMPTALLLRADEVIE